MFWDALREAAINRYDRNERFLFLKIAKQNWNLSRVQIEKGLFTANWETKYFLKFIVKIFELSFFILSR